MTLERLVQIVVEVIEKIAALQRLQVGVWVFDKADMERTCEYAQQVNGVYRLFESGDKAEEADREPCDLIFLDRLPEHCLAKLALGINDDRLSLCINATILKGGTVFVLNSGNGLCEKTPVAYAGLLKKYIKTLETYGYVFLNSKRITPEVAGAAETGKIFYRKKVLTKADLLSLESNSVVAVAPSVLITELARETARYRHIEIVQS